jgi:hypothetical protein
MRRVLLEKLTGPKLVEKFLTYYGKFSTAFTGDHHLFYPEAGQPSSCPDPTS